MSVSSSKLWSKHCIRADANDKSSLISEIYSLRNQLHQSHREKLEITCRQRDLDSLSSKISIIERELREMKENLVNINKPKIDPKILTEITCTICTEYLVAATVLNCSHVFCRACIDGWMRTSPLNTGCPICRQHMRFQVPDLALDNLIATVLDVHLKDDDKTERAQLVQSRRGQ